MIRLRVWVRITFAMLATLLLLGAATATAATPRASFNDIEDELMCVTCNVPLNIANSPQAERERARVRQLIAQGLTKKQVMGQMKADLGPEVLADPPRDGFNITTWLVPIGAVGGVALLLALTLPRWRRKGTDGDDEATADHGPSLSSDDLRRLDDDLAATEV